ncbi:MAG: helix-turn-helix domain-containing protein, partial [Chitinispirillaceae bacterium]|nr:helix-turn-helix domain-containing protein [Chitinispirillaceae bacterium]
MNFELIKNSLGRVIRILRKNAGYSQEDFAFECNLHRTYLGAIERGERNISLRNLICIAETLKLPLSVLIKKTERYALSKSGVKIAAFFSVQEEKEVMIKQDINKFNRCFYDTSREYTKPFYPPRIEMTAEIVVNRHTDNTRLQRRLIMSYIFRTSGILLAILLLMSCNLSDPTSPQKSIEPIVNSPSASADTTLYSGYYLNQPIRYRIRPDGNYLFAGDIVLKPEWVTKGFAKSSAPATRLVGRWPHGYIPYTVDAGFPNWNYVAEAISDLNTNSNIQVIPRTTESDYIRFQSVAGDGGLCHGIGNVGGELIIEIGTGVDHRCIPEHEILHAAGLHHEHQRTDRDLHIMYHEENVQLTPIDMRDQ